ncbi:hypothetical protein [Neobacillus endophyticus]|uniref:hypothetical protein n=1 Tax=Neobacillus endophyticus TaxID=2738405 RepID=UPI001C2680BF|nr:hypothetical protein [Neobacillus endophyticus]
MKNLWIAAFHFIMVVNPLNGRIVEEDNSKWLSNLVLLRIKFLKGKKHENRSIRSF